MGTPAVPTEWQREWRADEEKEDEHDTVEDAVARAAYNAAKEHNALNQTEPTKGMRWGTLQFHIRRDTGSFELPVVMKAAKDLFDALVKNACMATDGMGYVKFIDPIELMEEEEADEEEEDEEVSHAD